MWLSRLMPRSQASTGSGWPKVWLLLVMTAHLPGCVDGSAQGEYVKRVADVLNVEPVLGLESLAAVPTGRMLQIAITPQEISALQFAGLHRCDLGGLAGERNSSLGRLASASQRLGYEMRWQCRAPMCELDWLSQITLNKRGQLRAMMWNAVIAGPEMATALTNSQDVLPDAGGLTRLNDLIREVSERRYCDFSQETFEEALNRLRLGLPIKHQRQKWAGYRVVLDGVSALLTENPVCLSGAPTVKAERLFAVFRRHYVQALQPELNRGLGNDRVWIDALAQLSGRFQPVVPASWVEFYRLSLDPDSANSEWRRTRLSITRHAEAWQGLFKQCGVDIRSVAGGAS